MLYIRVCPGLSCATKRIGPPCCTLVTFVTCYPLQITLSQNYLLPIISVLAENTLLKTACHFLLLLVGFNTLTYRKDYDRSPILVGHQDSFLTLLPGSLHTSQDIPSTHHKLLSLALLYLPFASRFPLPHFTLAVLFAILLFVFSFALISYLALLLNREPKIYGSSSAC